MLTSYADGIPTPRRYGAILTIILSISIAVLDGAIANVALPTIARELQASPAASIWVVNAYQLSIIMTLLSFASLGDIYGYRRVYQCGLALFSLMSLACALSDSLWMLIGARILQGLGAAAVMSINTALIRIIYPQSKLGRGIALNTLVVAVSTAAGPTIAAAILSVASWQWLFAVNVPIGAVALFLGHRFLPANNQKNGGQQFNIFSALMNALTFGLLLLGLGGFAQGVDVGWVLLDLILALLALGIYVRHQLNQPWPLLPVDLLKLPLFSLSIGTSICSFSAQMLAMVSLPFYLQTVLGRDEVATGLLLTPWPLATMLFAMLAGRLIGRVNGGLLGAVGLSFFALGLFSLAWLPAAPDDGQIIWRMMLCGAGFGLFQSPNNHIIITAAPRHRSGGASGMLSTARLFGQTLGAALVAMMFNLFGDTGTHAALLLAGGFAAAAALVSALRISQRNQAG
ncbi:MFS transporter [Biostraticola tofi]|uniref:DHA2 family multidrug resistance protein-like MFS transporter n=1 Tax=Biostraticola tofi TaxID=466109 RepID=A0A4R3Z7H0_9GAMM|nr:MFS transporter [Biostraticola tofi]TCV99999.1 DHA2 family multidrug resistance protein-like MFS transporter [Biostraticola tofi]